MSGEVYDLSKGFDSLAAEMLYACMWGGPPEGELTFLERRIRANGGLALDQACGTGRHLFPLQKRGLKVHGADASADALRFARMAAEEHQVTPTLFHQRMEECDIPHRYGTIYVANGTFQILGDREQAFRTLERFRQHLVPGGELLLELIVPEEAKEGGGNTDVDNPVRWPPEPRHGAEGEIVTTLWSESVDLFEQILVSKRRYELMVDGKCVRTEVHAHDLRWYYQHEMVMMLDRAGYEEIRTYGDYSEDEATADSRLVVYSGHSV